MQKWLDDNDVLINSTYNEGKLVVAERFIRILKGKIYKKNAANDSKSYLGYLNKLVDQYNNTYRGLLITNTFMLSVLLCLKNLNRVIKLLILRFVIESGLTSVRRVFLAKATLKNDQKRYF